MQRLRLTFAKTVAMKYTGHLDLHTAWERTFRRARLPLAYSRGFHPQPRIQLAAALPLGFTSNCEIADVWMETVQVLDAARAALEAAAPPGLRILEVAEAPLDAPALQTQVRSAEYLVTVPDPLYPQVLDERIAALLAQPEVQRVRREKAYDLRPLIETLERAGSDERGHILHMRLTAREGATGRPEEVVAALGADVARARYHRAQLIIT